MFLFNPARTTDTRDCVAVFFFLHFIFSSDESRALEKGSILVFFVVGIVP